MENASKAIIIVGGVLVAILIISLSIYMLNNARQLAKTSNTNLKISEALNFNRFFEAYGPGNTDIAINQLDAFNIIGKAEDINEQYGTVMIKINSRFDKSTYRRRIK